MFLPQWWYFSFLNAKFLIWIHIIKCDKEVPINIILSVHWQWVFKWHSKMYFYFWNFDGLIAISLKFNLICKVSYETSHKIIKSHTQTNLFQKTYSEGPYMYLLIKKFRTPYFSNCSKTKSDNSMKCCKLDIHYVPLMVSVSLLYINHILEIEDKLICLS